MRHSAPNTCNVLQLDEIRQSLWRFSTGGGNANFSGEQFTAPGTRLPGGWVGKGWRSLLESKLNLAWLPADQVFLRVVQLPKCEFDELLPMVEFQLEKLSPLPVGQIVWTVESVPSHSSLPSELQTVVVIIAARAVVEQHLGRCEGSGFLADRLEVPLLHQMLATQIEGDGAWLYPVVDVGQTACLIAWWYNGVLVNLSYVHLTAKENWSRELGDQLTKTAWAGELEGWLTEAPKWHLVAERKTCTEWEPLLPETPGHTVGEVAPLAPAALAALAAQRAARRESRANLVPDELRLRYHQQYVDRVWMRGLGAVAVLYIIGVLVYFGFLFSAEAQKAALDKEVAALGVTYTNTLVTEARIQILQEQIALKNAVLEGLKAVSDKLPDGLTLTDFSCQRGKTMLLIGTAPLDKGDKITDFSEALRKYEVRGIPLFTAVNAPSRAQNGPTMRWQFSCEIKSPGSE